MPKRVALIVWSEAYQDPTLSRLRAPKVDIEALAAVLREPAIGNFQPVEMAINQPGHQVRRRIADLFHHKKPYDLLLLYVGGHGLFAEGEQLYLATVDTRLEALAETAIPATYIAGWMDRSFSRQQILILDCLYCQTSKVFKTFEVSSFSTGLAAAFRGRGVGRVVLTVTGAVQYTLAGAEVKGEAEGIGFAANLIQGLRTGAADVNEDGQVGIRELYDYLCAQAALSGHIQRPRQWTYREPDDFIIAHNPKKVEPTRPVKWDLIFGAIMAPAATIIIGGSADLRTSIGMAGLFLLLYAFLYWVLD